MEPIKNTPVMDVKAPAETKTEARPQIDPNSKKVTTQVKTKAAPRSDNVNLAIFATIVIVLSLAILATLAYLKQK